MDVISKKQALSGSIRVPGSKSHTIRALILATFAEGRSVIHNPLPSADCLSTAAAVPLIGAEIDLNLTTEGECGSSWVVEGAGSHIHLPDDVVNVGNSGSLLYFMAPVAATLDGWSVFTGDESIRKRPVDHVADVIRQMGGEAFISQPGSKCCPLLVRGPVTTSGKIVTEGSVSSQYITGLMLAALRMKGAMEIELTNPKETPYLTMTQKWLETVGAKVTISPDFHHITVLPPAEFKGFERTIPSDWEAVAFPLIAALISDSEIIIENIDGSGTQGDDAVVEILQSLGADISWNKDDETLTVRGGKKAQDGIGRLSTENLPQKELHVAMSGFPDAICALAVIACFTEGTVVLEDAAVCRRKETDRISVLKKELEELGADVEEGEDYLIIHGHSPLLADGSANPAFTLHGGVCESYGDHRIAMSMACLGLGLGGSEEIIVHNAECCAVSFPRFFEEMNKIGAHFKEA